jgi:hypothetical protein
LAASSANQASNSAASASASQGTATQAAIHAQNSKVVAQQWAVNPEDVPVDGGQFSAYHWAQKAAEVVGQGGVGSVFGRSGAVVAMAGDYSVAQITGAASQAAVDSANAAQNAEIALRATITAVDAANAAQDAEIALRATIAAVDAANAAQDAVIAAKVTGVRQTSPTDTTAGALMAVGAFGLGTQQAVLADPDLATTNGFFRVVGSAKMPTTGPWNVMNQVYDTAGSQLAVLAGNPNLQDVYIRTRSGGGWGAWRQMATLDAARTVPLSTTAGTLVLADKGKCVEAAASITVPSGVFASGDVVSVYCNSLSSISIIAGVGLTMATVGGGAGNRTLATRGIATLWFVSPTFVVCNGAGVS